ncbi:MAG: glycosyltransferase family 4 protein [Planctomycetes bacterium]|nr:glycosyltransferase family 4 protein [Planctomycetota bacterium]
MTMHVAVSGWLLGPPSGANRRLVALLRRVGRHLAANEAVTLLHREGHRPPQIAGIRMQAVAIPPGPPLRRVLAERAFLAPLLRGLGATVLDHGFLPLPRVGIATCLLVHDVRGAAGLSLWPRFVARAELRASCSRATRVVVPSEWTKGELARLAARPDAIVVPNGVEPVPAAPPRLEPRAALLHVGHLEPRKNLAVLVRALARLPNERRPLLQFVGRDAGSGRRLDRLAARLGVRDDVRRLGEVDDAELAVLYANAHAVVVPSRHEGFGLCALEGLAHGRPVLASAAAALPEVLGDAGTLLPPDDVDAWATALTSLPPDDEPARERRRARAAAFSWDVAAQRLVAVWREAHAAGR